jgi:hypothetical protein
LVDELPMFGQLWLLFPPLGGAVVDGAVVDGGVVVDDVWAEATVRAAPLSSPTIAPPTASATMRYLIPSPPLARGEIQ